MDELESDYDVKTISSSFQPIQSVFSKKSHLTLWVNATEIFGLTQTPLQLVLDFDAGLSLETKSKFSVPEIPR